MDWNKKTGLKKLYRPAKKKEASSNIRYEKRIFELKMLLCQHFVYINRNKKWQLFRSIPVLRNVFQIYLCFVFNSSTVTEFAFVL